MLKIVLTDIHLEINRLTESLSGVLIHVYIGVAALEYLTIARICLPEENICLNII